MTTARFYTPSGRSIQADGITPDILVPSRLPPEVQVLREKDLDRHLIGENEKADPKDKGKNSKPETAEAADKEKEEFEIPTKPLSELPLAERLKFDPQLDKALTLLKSNQVPLKFTAVRR